MLGREDFRRVIDLRAASGDHEDVRLSEAEVGVYERLVQSNFTLSRRLDLALRQTHLISLAEHTVLMRLNGAGGDMRMSDLASSSLLSPSGASRLVDRLSVDGLVRRQACPVDGRAVHAVITEEGRRRLKEAGYTYVAELRHAFGDRFSESELGALSVLLGRVLGACRLDS
jgi:DNA-binding MarR family transcriptional regulator